jgi:hypothetical protein
LAVAVTIASRIVTRRALLGAGAVALLAGCGPTQEPEVDAGAVLAEQQRLTERVVGSYEGVPLSGALRANAQARVRRLNAVRERFPGRSATFEKEPDTGLEAALAAESAALRAHVAAVGELKAAEFRELLAGLVADAAANQAALLLRLGRPAAPTPFPGEPV